MKKNEITIVQNVTDAHPELTANVAKQHQNDASVIRACTMDVAKTLDLVSIALAQMTTPESVANMNTTLAKLEPARTVPLVLITVLDLLAFVHMDTQVKLAKKTSLTARRIPALHRLLVSILLANSSANVHLT